MAFGNDWDSGTDTDTASSHWIEQFEFSDLMALPEEEPDRELFWLKEHATRRDTPMETLDQ